MSKSTNVLFSEVKVCLACGHNELQKLIDLGSSPLAGYFPIVGQASEEFRVPLTLVKCTKCTIVQSTPNVSDELLFSDYRYVSGFAMNYHFKELASWINNYFKGQRLSILEIGSNDGSLMDHLATYGHDAVGVDPARNIADLAIQKGHRVFCDYFSDRFVRQHSLNETFEIAISTNAFAHVSNIREIVSGVSLALKKEGKFIIEVQSWPQLVEKKAFDFVYHEHKFYYDLRSIQNLCNKFNLQLEHAQLVESHGGSYRLIFSKSESPQFVNDELMSFEHKSNAEILEAFEDYRNKIIYSRQKLQVMSSEGSKIIGFGASGRGNMIAGPFNFNTVIQEVFDESPERIGRELGLSGIHVSDFRLLRSADYDICFIFSWNHVDQIVAKWPHKGKKLIVPLPEYREIPIL